MNTNKLKQENEITKRKSFMWNKHWVRPYESLWSIMHNFRIVNHCFSYKEALKMLDLDDKHLVVPRYDSRLGVFNILSDKFNDYSTVNEQLLPEWYQDYFTIINKAMSDCPYFISLQLRYCPECIKQGYHSILHQLSGLTYCPFHQHKKLKIYLNDSYVFGSIKKYEADRSKTDSYMAMTMRNIGMHALDFEDFEQFPLPTEWMIISELTEFCLYNPIEYNFDSIYLLSSDHANPNMPPKIGKFLLKSYKKAPIVKIYDTMIEKYEEEKIMDELKELNPAFKSFALNYEYHEYIDILLQICISKLLKEYSEEQISYKCYQLQTEEQISFSDELGIRLLYINKLIGCRFLKNSVKVGYPETFSLEYNEKYNTKDTINIRNCSYISVGKAMAYHVIKQHVHITFQEFLKRIYRISKIQEKLDINLDIDNIEIPYFLVGTKDGIKYLYMLK